MTAAASLLRALPRDDSGQPAEPPLLADDAFARLLDEVIGSRGGLGWSLSGDLPAALGARLAQGERRNHGSPLVEEFTAVDGEASDAFAGRVAGPPGRTPGERLMQTAAWARAAAELLADGGNGPNIGVLDGHRLWLAPAPAGRPVPDIATEIGEALSLRHFQSIAALGHADVPAVVALDRRSIQEARHAHRTDGLRGPWLGICIGNRTHHAPPLELVSCARHRLGADELGGLMRRLHLLADGLLAALPDGSTQAIARELTRKFGDLWRPRRSWRIPPRTDGRETYLSRSLDPARGDAPIADLASTAWGLGVALHRFLQPLGWSGPLSPAIRVLHRADDSPEGRRAVLTAVRFDGGRPESASVFATRFAEQCAREASGFGLLSEWQRRVHRQPLSGSGRARFATGLEGLGRMAGPVSALRGVAELGWGTLTPRREAPWRVYTGTTPPAAPWGAGFTGGLALHVQRIGDTTDLLATASGTFGERDRAPQLMDAILEAIRSA